MWRVMLMRWHCFYYYCCDDNIDGCLCWWILMRMSCWFDEFVASSPFPFHHGEDLLFFDCWARLVFAEPRGACLAVALSSHPRRQCLLPCCNVMWIVMWRDWEWFLRILAFSIFLFGPAGPHQITIYRMFYRLSALCCCFFWESGCYSGTRSWSPITFEASHYFSISVILSYLCNYYGT